MTMDAISEDTLSKIAKDIGDEFGVEAKAVWLNVPLRVRWTRSGSGWINLQVSEWLALLPVDALTYVLRMVFAMVYRPETYAQEYDGYSPREWLDRNGYADFILDGAMKSLGVQERIRDDGWYVVVDEYGRGYKVISEWLKIRSVPYNNHPVTVKCYDEVTHYSTRAQALAHFQDCVSHSCGCERERYQRIFDQLNGGKDEATDEEE